jgi:hypothetical protein
LSKLCYILYSPFIGTSVGRITGGGCGLSFLDAFTMEMIVGVAQEAKRQIRKRITSLPNT